MIPSLPSELLKRAVSAYPSSVLVDVGANLGIHTLAAASVGASVWAVEPLTQNLVKVGSIVN